MFGKLVLDEHNTFHLDESKIDLHKYLSHIDTMIFEQLWDYSNLESHYEVLKHHKCNVE